MTDVAGVAVHSTGARGRLAKGRLFAGFFALEAMVFAILPLSARFPGRPLLIFHAVLTAVMLAAAMLARRSETGKRYGQVFYALFVAGMAVLLSTLFGQGLLEALPLTPVSPAWVAVAKLSESLWRVTTILLLMVAGGAELRSMYLTGGRTRLGLTIGLAGFALFAALAFLPLARQEGGWQKLAPLWPWIATFVLANGFAEELLFRGLFLERYEAFLGKWAANLLTALVFTLLHLQAGYVSQMVTFLSILFPLALLWGYVMQRTRSLWGAALLHAGADCLLIFRIYASL